MKKSKILLTVIKESDGGFSVLGHPGKNQKELVSTQADTWEELKESALTAVNGFLKDKGHVPVTMEEISFSFDLPSFLDTYPQLTTSALAEGADTKTARVKQPATGKKKAPDRQLHRILSAVKQLDKAPTASKAKR